FLVRFASPSALCIRETLYVVHLEKASRENYSFHTIAAVLPFEFVVIGRPVPHGNRDKVELRRWRKVVREAAIAAWPAKAPVGGLIQVTITHYYDSKNLEYGTLPDSDAIVKPVSDALNGIVYVDDYQISDFVNRRRDVNSSFRVKGMSPALAKGFCSGQEFLHLQIVEQPDPEVLE
ncbi:MAG: RusA family crossover junction endodeoxyribonuclease, partial [Cyanobacteria bacterium J06621_3]